LPLLLLLFVFRFVEVVRWGGFPVVAMMILRVARGQLNAQVVTPFSCPIECCPYGHGSAIVWAAAGDGGAARCSGGRPGLFWAGNLPGPIRLLVVAVAGTAAAGTLDGSAF
jgi:hypothetical protein